MGKNSGYKPWKNYSEKPTVQTTQTPEIDSKQDVKDFTKELAHEAPKVTVPKEETKVIKLEEGSSALVTHSDVKSRKPLNE